jgi:hypothetical protein
MARRSAAQMGMAGARGEIVTSVLADQPLQSHAGITVRFHDPNGRGGRPSTNATLVGLWDHQSYRDHSCGTGRRPLHLHSVVWPFPLLGSIVAVLDFRKRRDRPAWRRRLESSTSKG